MVPSRGKGDGKSGGKGPVMASASLAVDIISHGALEAWEAWEEAPLVEHARVLSSLREAPPKHAFPQRLPPELRKKL